MATTALRFFFLTLLQPISIWSKCFRQSGRASLFARSGLGGFLEF
jgi:hypothetical protein